jgi:histidyl-tRNA synthetase
MELAGRSLKGQLRQAERLGARFFALVEGESVLLRDLRDGTEETVERGALLDRLVAA